MNHSYRHYRWPSGTCWHGLRNLFYHSGFRLSIYNLSKSKGFRPNSCLYSTSPSLPWVQVLFDRFSYCKEGRLSQQQTVIQIWKKNPGFSKISQHVWGKFQLQWQSRYDLYALLIYFVCHARLNNSPVITISNSILSILCP